MHTTMRIPHGQSNMHTVELEVEIPHGILVLKPEVPEDWTVNIETRVLSDAETYMSHGVLKTTAPSRLIFTADTHADGVHDDHLLNIDMQLKIGCMFNDTSSNTLWNNQYTLWWKTKQTCSDVNGSLVLMNWNGTQADSANGVSPVERPALPDATSSIPICRHWQSLQ